MSHMQTAADFIAALDVDESVKAMQLESVSRALMPWLQQAPAAEVNQLAQGRVEGLFAHAEQGQQFLDADTGVVSDKKNNTLMHPTQPTTCQHFIRFGGKCLIAKEEGFHGGALSGRIFKVKHIDVSRVRGVVSVKQFDLFPITSATGDLYGLLRTCFPPEKFFDS